MGNKYTALQFCAVHASYPNLFEWEAEPNILFLITGQLYILGQDMKSWGSEADTALEITHGDGGRMARLFLWQDFA